MHAHSRRGFLQRTLGALWTGAALLEQSAFRAAAARAQAPAAAAAPPLFDLRQVAEGIYAAVARPQPVLNCNGAIFVNARDVLVVDTHSKPSAVAALVAQIRREITDKPVRWVVNTHFHWDHSQGTPAYRRIAPHAQVVSSTATRRLLSEHGDARLKASVDGARESLDGYKRSLAAAKSPAEKSYYQSMVDQTGAYIREMQDYEPVLPDVTFDRDLVIHDPAHVIHLAFRGRGHTAGDIVVWCPRKRVIATGDLVHGFLPFIGDGYPLEWPRTLLHVAGFEFDHVLGGHGAAQQGRERLYQMRDYIEELTEVTVHGRRAGKSLDELRREVTPASLASLERGGYGHFVAGSVASHTMNPPGTSHADILAAGVRSNLEQVYSALEKS